MRTTQEAEVVKIKCKLFYFSKIFDFYHSDIFCYTYPCVYPIEHESFYPYYAHNLTVDIPLISDILST